MVSLYDQVKDTAKFTNVCGLFSEENDKCHLEVCGNKDVIFPKLMPPPNSLIHTLQIHGTPGKGHKHGNIQWRNNRERFHF